MSRQETRAAGSAATASPVRTSAPHIETGTCAAVPARGCLISAACRAVIASAPPGLARAAAVCLALFDPQAAAAANALDALAGQSAALTFIDQRSAIGSAIVMGLVIFSTTLSVLHVRERRRWTERERRFAAEIDELRAAGDRTEILTQSERQVIAVWSDRESEPHFDGDPTLVGEHAGFDRVLAFESWLAPAEAGLIEADIERLRSRGESFRRTLPTLGRAHIEAEGRTVSGRALLRLRDVTGERSSLLRAQSEIGEVRADLSRLRELVDAIEAPVWLKGADGRLVWANRAYCEAVEAAGIDDARTRSLELLDRSDRAESERCRGAGDIFRARVAAIVTGIRRVLDITEAPVAGGSGGIAQDVSELETLRADLSRQRQAHVRTLDGLPTAVAMFDAKQRLLFYNAAYRELWGLDSAFLDSVPTDGDILDQLRAARRLPEQADFRSWKAGVLEIYRAADAQEHWWYLPDRRTLRVVTTPNPGGGVTYLFEDVSERVELESRYNALIRVQRETLDTLSEGVALFGADGRLKLYNQAFLRLWRVNREALGNEPHVDAVVGLCRELAPDSECWAELSSAVFGMTEMRLTQTVRMERRDGSVLDCAAEPLPDGATLLTFVDMTASVNVERALTERNEALERAGRLRNEFVHHVSYELRSPLTNVIGFAELLNAGTVGPLNERQHEYAGHIMRSSGALLAIINDILDLASIDTDAMELVRERVDIVQTIEAAAKGVQDRLVEANLKLEIDAAPGIGSFVADPKRVRQILFNLLSNAAGFSSPGQTIRVSAHRRDGDGSASGEVVLSVSDQGRGIPSEVQERVFERFETHTDGTAHRGVGLGLSIVRSFVELHGGRVALDTEPGRGTTVTCVFPADGKSPLELAA
jgi:signal transduction histidine kinase